MYLVHLIGVFELLKGLGERGFGDAVFRHDCGDQGGGGDVEGGVEDVHLAGRGFTGAEAGDLVARALLDRDACAIGGVQIDGAGGGGDVEGDAEMFGEDGDLVGADFVGGVAVGGDAVG